MSYRVIVPKSVQKQLDSLPANVRNRVIERLILLAENPRPLGVVELKGCEDEDRIRIGDYRIRYEIRDQESVVLLLYCKHRRDVYGRCSVLVLKAVLWAI